MWASLLIPHAHNDEFLVLLFFLFEILPKYVGRGVTVGIFIVLKETKARVKYNNNHIN